jgi:hypothetical protein
LRELQISEYDIGIVVRIADETPLEAGDPGDPEVLIGGLA